MRIPPISALLLLAACTPQPDTRGEALFLGHDPMVGRIQGDLTPLPQIATRCVTCHNADASQATVQSGDSYALWLDRAELSTSRSRRGGPASSYDVDAFCRLLRTGVDPAHLIISTIMPRYQVADESCHALWRYVESR